MSILLFLVLDVDAREIPKQLGRYLGVTAVCRLPLPVSYVMCCLVYLFTLKWNSPFVV